MAVYELTIDPTYQQSEWGLTEAIREIVANAHDSEKRGESEMKVKYLKRSGELIVESRGTKVPMSALLMGTSTARDCADNIGTFGEGLVMALKTLALLQQQGYLSEFKIENDDEVWRPYIEHSSAWGGPVLKVQTRQLKNARGAFRVMFTPIDGETWEKLRRLFLFLDPDFKVKNTVKARSYGYDRILTDDQYKGSIYVKGVFVNQREDLAYGYDLDMPLNRDRKMMDEWDLKYKLQKMLAAALETYPTKFGQKVVALVESGDSMEVQGGAGALSWSTAVKDAVNEEFEAKHGEDAIPVSNMSEAKELHALGRKGIVVSTAVKDLVESRKGSLESRKHKAKMASTKTYSWSDLEESERENIDRCVELVNRCGIVQGTEDLMDVLKVVDFADERQVGRYNRVDGEIMLAKRIVNDFKETLKTLVHEICHRDWAAGDGTDRHHDLMEDAWADMVCRLVQDNVTPIVGKEGK